MSRPEIDALRELALARARAWFAEFEDLMPAFSDERQKQVIINQLASAYLDGRCDQLREIEHTSNTKGHSTHDSSSSKFD